jgi:glycosyltransferase involved in cell wall biosynthesis
MCVTAIDLAPTTGSTPHIVRLTRTTGDFVITLDDDLQQPPDEIARLIEKAGEGHDLVCGRSAVRLEAVRELDDRAARPVALPQTGGLRLHQLSPDAARRRGAAV